MQKFISKLMIAIISGSLMLGLSSTAFAQKGSDEKKTKETVAMSQSVYEKLTEIQELIEAKDYASAQRLTDELRGKKGLSPYEIAQIWNISGYSYYLQERYDDAIRAYDNVMAQRPGAVPTGQVRRGAGSDQNRDRHVPPAGPGAKRELATAVARDLL
jgi:outer membrane protein assembly factor BamD (BamD/ComL family)